MKNRVLTLLLSITLVYVSATASAVAPHISTLGVPPCGTWVKDRQDPKARLLSKTNEYWLVGYLTGLSVGIGKDFLNGTDPDSLFLWVDNYCRANPLSDAAYAADGLATVLIRNKGL